MRISEKCPCGSSAEFDTADKGDKKLWKAFLDAHEDCSDSRPKVIGSGVTAERGSRTDPNHEFYNSRRKVPIIYAEAIPFGFVSNEKNEEWTKP